MTTSAGHLGFGTFCLEESRVWKHEQLEGILDDVSVFDVDYCEVVKFIECVKLVPHWATPRHTHTPMHQSPPIQSAATSLALHTAHQLNQTKQRTS